MVLEADHSTFGGSSAKRWGICPGSLVLAKQVGSTSGDSPWAAEGTEAHAVAERILSGWEPPSHINPEMVFHGRNYAAGVNTYKTLYGALSIDVERKVISNRYPDVGGTIDAAVDARKARTMVIIDYKYGAGVPVSPTNNEQLKFYAAIYLENLLPSFDGLYAGDVILSIFQPRGIDAGWKEWETSGEEIYRFKETIYERVEAIKQGDVSLTPGPECRWCEAKPACPAYFEAYIEPLLPKTPIPQLSNAQIHDLYKNAPSLAKYIESLGGYIKKQCESFGTFESYTLGKGKGQTKWLNPIQIEAEFDPKKYPGMYNTTLRTPKQIIEMYPQLREDLEGQYTQTTYDKLITNDSTDFPDNYDE